MVSHPFRLFLKIVVVIVFVVVHRTQFDYDNEHTDRKCNKVELITFSLTAYSLIA